MNTNRLLMPIKTMQMAISSTETVTKELFNNYVKVLSVLVGGEVEVLLQSFTIKQDWMGFYYL